MDKIKVAVLNPTAISEAEKMMLSPFFSSVSK